MRARILLVDDTETVLMFEKMMLNGQGYELQVAKNGLEAIAKIPVFNPHLILMDIMMPELDGIETLRRIKADARMKHLPVIMVTTKGEPERVEQAFLAGCCDYLTKPVDKLELLTKVRAHLGTAAAAPAARGLEARL